MGARRPPRAYRRRGLRAVVGTLKLVAQRQRATGGVRSMEHYGAGVGGAANADESSLELLS